MAQTTAEPERCVMLQTQLTCTPACQENLQERLPEGLFATPKPVTLADELSDPPVVVFGI